MRLLLPLLALAVALFGQTTRELRLAHLVDPQSVAEAMTVLRSLTEVRDVRLDAPSRTVIISGAPWQTDLADWLFPRLDRGPGEPHPIVEQYTIPGIADAPAVRMYHPARADSAIGLQELNTVIRSIAETRRAFVSNRTRALAMRGSQDEIAVADWLFEELDQNQYAHAASAIWRMPQPGGVVRVFYLTASMTREELHRNVAEIRLETKIPSMFVSNVYRAVVVRGTEEQIALAEKLLRERGLSAARSAFRRNSVSASGADPTYPPRGT